MSTKSRLLAVVAVSALGVGAAAPVMAFENEFHGMYRLRGFVSNFDNGGGGSQFSADPAKPGALNLHNPKTSSYIEQRARLMYIAKASDDLKLVTHFEIDSRWGDNSYNSNGTTRNNGGAIAGDSTNLETKNVYLDFNIPSTPVNVKAGLQFWNLGYKGIIFNDDASGLVVNSKLSNGSVGLAYFRFDDATTGGSYIASGSGSGTTVSTDVVNAYPGKRTRDFLTLGGKYNITKDLKVGADYALLYSDILDNRQDRTSIHMFGVNGEYVLDQATIDGFVVYQAGNLGNAAVPGQGQDVSAFAANLGGRVKAGPGTARTNFLYISGDSSPSSGERGDFQTIMERGATTNAHGFTPSEMVLMLDNKYNLTSAQTVVKDLNNNAQGFIGGFLGYDLTIDKFFVNTNLGFGAVAEDNNYGGAHESNYLGTEINTEIGYKIYPNMTVSVIGAYMLLGDYFKDKAVDVAGEDPANPYTARVMFNYTF